jgi:hypothetical protein
MMKPNDAERVTGYKVGGISPFGQMRKLPIVIEAQALAHDLVHINGGQRGLQVRLKPRDVLSIPDVQVSRLDVPNIFPITNWNSDKIVAAESGDTVACRKATINIQRKMKTAVWIEEPINQTHPTCKETHTKTYNWTIEDPPFWKQK